MAGASKLAVKSLTQSDLTFFEWQHRNRDVGHQKAINLNADVFIRQLYPSLPEAARPDDSRIPLDLFVYGPGMHGEHNLQRKIIKGGTYKNWRLDGEFIYNPETSPDRYNSLSPDDIAVLDFHGDVQPHSARLFLLAADQPEDRALNGGFSNLLGGSSMIRVAPHRIETLVTRIDPPTDHPIRQLLLDDELQLVAAGGAEGHDEIQNTGSDFFMSRSALLEARSRANEIGEVGEEIVNEYLTGADDVVDIDWVSNRNAVAPYDFEIEFDDGTRVILDVKSTNGSFERKLHISVPELEAMCNRSQRYDLYRVYELDEAGARLRVAEDVSGFAGQVLTSLGNLPRGVTSSGIIVDPETLTFGGAVELPSLNLD